MSRKCSVCGKGPKKAASRSHSKVKTLRVQKPNLQKNEKGELVCTKCIKTKAKENK